MRTALRRLAVLAALARGERRGFITMTVQRTGSTWLSDELDAHPSGRFFDTAGTPAAREFASGASPRPKPRGWGA